MVKGVEGIVIWEIGRDGKGDDDMVSDSVLVFFLVSLRLLLLLDKGGSRVLTVTESGHVHALYLQLQSPLRADGVETSGHGHESETS